jgi:hypothetical protein
LILVPGLLLALVLAISILYPDDPEDRVARIQRAAITTFVFAAVLGAMESVVIPLLETGEAGVLNPILVIANIQLSAVPISAAERIAGLFRPRRVPLWACAGVTVCLAWSALLYLLLTSGIPSPPALTAIVGFGTPAIAAGLAWFGLLPRRDSSVREIFR